MKTPATEAAAAVVAEAARRKPGKAIAPNKREKPIFFFLRWYFFGGQAWKGPLYDAGWGNFASHRWADSGWTGANVRHF